MLLLVILLSIVAVLALRGLIVMLLWNWLIPMLTTLPEISFFEAVGLFLLCSFLFGTFIDKNILPKKEVSK